MVELEELEVKQVGKQTGVGAGAEQPMLGFEAQVPVVESTVVPAEELVDFAEQVLAGSMLGVVVNFLAVQVVVAVVVPVERMPKLVVAELVALHLVEVQEQVQSAVEPIEVEFVARVVAVAKLGFAVEQEVAVNRLCLGIRRPHLMNPV